MIAAVLMFFSGIIFDRFFQWKVKRSKIKFLKNSLLNEIGINIQMISAVNSEVFDIKKDFSKYPISYEVFKTICSDSDAVEFFNKKMILSDLWECITVSRLLQNQDMEYWSGISKNFLEPKGFHKGKEISILKDRLVELSEKLEKIKC